MCWSRASGALVVLVAVQLSVLGLYLRAGVQISIAVVRPRRSFHCLSRLPCDCSRAMGALVVLVSIQVSVLGLYLPPVFVMRPTSANPPQTIISLPVHTAV